MSTKKSADVHPYTDCVDIYAVFNGIGDTIRMDYETARVVCEKLKVALEIHPPKPPPPTPPLPPSIELR